MEFVASKVVDAGLSSLFQRMFDTLSSTPFLKSLGSLGFLFGGVRGEAEKLKSTFSRIQAHLDDAEDRQIKEKSVRLWLRELKDAAYDAEDILDEVECVVIRSKVEAPMQTRKRKRTDQVSDLFSSSVSNLNMSSRIKEIRERLEEIESRSNHLNLKVILKSERCIPSKRPPTGSFVDESIIFGRETDREKVVGLLTSSASSASDSSILQVVPICGMGGLGKTTLAQLIYNDERVKKHFDVNAWAYVSEYFDLFRVTKAILESATKSECKLTSLNEIQVRIQEALQEKRFLLVLDDVWNYNHKDWDALRAPLMVGARTGSRILVTTRSQRVSAIKGTVPTHSLQGLSDDDCWSLFKRRAFVEENSDAHPELVEIGKKIVKKCNGLPLAVKTLGSLCCKENARKWEQILKSEIWDLPEEGDDILPALKLSYHHLPAHLKRCFAYCGCIVEKGSFFLERHFTEEWMAQGFIPSKGSEQMQDIAMEYFDDLVSRSLLSRAKYGYQLHGLTFDLGRANYRYQMHDLTCDLARAVLGADVLERVDGNSPENADRVRYMSHSCMSKMESINFEDLYCFKNLRTLRILFGTNNVPADLFVKLRHLRTLDLRGTAFTITHELLESIGNLSQLRYLDLSDTNIKGLPKSTARLYNLQTLRLNGCANLRELPCDFSNLVNLRKLSLIGCPVSTPPRISRLTSLQELSDFKVGKDIGCRINELKDLLLLRGSLCISELQNVVSVEEVKEAALSNKEKIDTLELKWSCGGGALRQEGIGIGIEEEEVLKALRPHSNLKSLYIEGYCGVTFPTWMGDSLYSNLVSVMLDSCRCHLLPPFGQLPSLKYLTLTELRGVKKVGREICGGDGTVKAFPSLESFHLESMPDLEKWSDLEGDFSHIREIGIYDCPKLRGIPHFPFTLRDLHISGCGKLFTNPRFSTILFLGDSSYSNLVSVRLDRCRCRLLPAFGQLPSLKYLTLEELRGVKKVGREICGGDGTVKAFPSLESFCLESMPDLEEWSDLEGDFSHIREIRICNCHKLRGIPHFPFTLRDLRIYGCGKLFTLPRFSTILELDLVRCDEQILSSLQYLPSLSVLQISEFSILTSLPNGLLLSLTSLEDLFIGYCPELKSLGDVVLPTALQKLSISGCENLKCLPTGLKNLTSLVKLVLGDCPEIHFLPEELPTALVELELCGCPLVMEKCKEGGEYWSRISHIPNIRCFP